MLHVMPDSINKILALTFMFSKVMDSKLWGPSVLRLYPVPFPFIWIKGSDLDWKIFLKAENEIETLFGFIAVIKLPLKLSIVILFAEKIEFSTSWTKSGFPLL